MRLGLVLGCYSLVAGLGLQSWVDCWQLLLLGLGCGLQLVLEQARETDQRLQWIGEAKLVVSAWGL